MTFKENYQTRLKNFKYNVEEGEGRGQFSAVVIFATLLLWAVVALLVGFFALLDATSWWLAVPVLVVALLVSGNIATTRKEEPK